MNPARRAIIALAENGWGKGQLKASNGALCIAGALHEGIFNKDGFYCKEGRLVTSIVRDIIASEFPERASDGCFPHFNDHPDTAIEDVIMVLEKAAAKLDERI